MLLDLPTLFIATIVANAVAGALLLFSWTRHRNIPALAIWSAGFILGTIATALIAAREQIPDLWSIVAGNSLLALAYGVMWSGVRSFERRPTSLPVMFAGAAIWLLACQLEFFYRSPELRVLLMALIVSGYLLLSSWEFWRSRGQGLSSRWPVIVLLLVHAGAYFGRVSLVSDWAMAPDKFTLHLGWIALLAFEGLFFTFCLAYLLGSMAHERVSSRYKADAYADPLTGIANRRGFFTRGENLVRRAKIDRRPAALLMFDLDEFKHVNDTYGHWAGDQVLRTFCRVATRALRPNDLFGRIGGEEFACLLVDTSVADALRIAERIRNDFASSSLDLGSTAVSSTVSIGVAALRSRHQTLTELLAAADEALYRAKANGRNRIEVSGPLAAEDRRIAVAG